MKKKKEKKRGASFHSIAESDELKIKGVLGVQESQAGRRRFYSQNTL